MKTQKMKSAVRSLTAGILVGVAGLAGLVQGASAQTNAVAQAPQSPIKTSGNVTYFLGADSNVGAPTSYAEINHKTTFPYSTSVSGFLDFYNGNNGYFGKTVVEKGLAENLNLRSHIEHINSPLSRVGAGLSYSIPGMPKGTFGKISYLPYFADNRGEHVENRQIAAFVAGASLPHNLSILTFGEMNVAGAEGVQWCYGEVELAKNFGRFSVGANLQLNGQGTGRATPEVVPRISVRARF